MKTPTIIAIIIGGTFVIGAFILSQDKTTTPVDAQPLNNVTVENGKQIVTISAKGGYLPRISEAKADMPTILRVDTNGTFDCSASLNIPSMNYQKNLPATGVTDIEIPAQKAGSTFEGLCGMGMYRFEIAFK
jgi:plastocyanin domain-containing protein